MEPEAACEDSAESPEAEASLWRSLAISLALTLALYALLTPSFATNDDVFIMDLASGRAAAGPTARLIHINIVLGGVLKGLYALLPSAPWYPLLLIAVQTFAWALAHRVLAGLRLGAAGAALFFIAWLVLGAPMLLRLQYTAAAMLVSGAGLVYAVSRSEPRLRWADLALSVAAFVLGLLLRPQAAQAALVFVAPALPLLFWPRTAWRRGLIAVGAALALALIAAFAQGRAYSGEDWRRFFELKDIRERIIDRTPILDDYLGEARPLGWSRNDLDLFHVYYHTRHPMYAASVLKELEKVSLKSRRRAKFHRVVRRMRRRLFADYPAALLLFAGALLVLLGRGRWPGALAVVAGAAAAYYALAWVLYHFNRVPPRIVAPALALAFLAALGQSGRLRRWSLGPSEARWRGAVFGLGAAAAVAAGVWALGQALAASGRHAGEQREHRRDAELLRSVAPAGLLVRMGAIDEYRRPVFADPGPRRGEPPIIVSWETRSPPWSARLDGLGIADLSRAIAERGDVTLVLLNDFPQLFAAYLREHYGMDVRVETLGSMWRCRLSIVRLRLR